MTLTGHRVEGFRFELLNLDDQVVAALPGVPVDAGQLDFSVYADIRGSGNLTVHGNSMDWLARRVRISYEHDGQAVPLITAIPRAPVEQHTATGVVTDVELYDKTLILAEDSFGESFAVPAGTNIVDTVAAVIVSTGEPAPTLLTPSPETLANPMVWEAGESKLRIVNDLLDAAGYFAVYTDGLGRFRADPYTDPATRPVRWRFTGREALFLPDWSRDRDVYAVPNRYICVGRSDGDTPALVATASNETDGPFSFAGRGRWITRVDTDVEASSQFTLDLLAVRRLFESQQVVETFEFTHPHLPFGLNEVVEFDNTRAVVWKQNVRLEVGGLVTSTARRLG